MILQSIISGGQTGADLAGVEAAVCLGLIPGGWVPKGCTNELGVIPDDLMKRYRFREHRSSAYPPRTRANVEASDGTVIFGVSSEPGSRLTIKLAKDLGRPVLVNPQGQALRDWLRQNRIVVLNCAGNRESRNPGIEERTFDFLVAELKIELHSLSRNW